MAITYAIKDIIDIRPSGSTDRGLEKTTVEGINDIVNSSPSKYAIVDNTSDNFIVLIDYKPTSTYNIDTYPDSKFIISYYPIYRILNDISKEDYEEFEDYDEDDMSLGKWKLPSDWHKLIVEGALAMIYPELEDRWTNKCDKLNRERFTESGMKLGTFLGVSNRANKRNRNPYNRLT